MKSCGVIVEYNPFHHGHAYHLREARKESQADCLVAVMSGNFLQRGEPACLDKWQRARVALENGADLVIELPFCYAVQSADYFTKGGVRLLQALQVDSLCFGTDSKESLDYEAFGTFSAQNESLINKTYQEMKNNGNSYPQQMTEVYRKLLPEWSLDFSSPNHILGMGYAKENAKYKYPMSLYPIKRVGNEYHDTTIQQNSFASATSIRHLAHQGHLSDITEVVPSSTFKQLLEEEIISWNQAWPLLKYNIISSSIEELKPIYQMVEGLEYRFKEAALKATDFHEFVSLVKSKRYTWTRIQRLSLYVLLNITKPIIDSAWQEEYIRVLGFNDCGREFLKTRKKETTFNIIANVNQKNDKQLELDIKAGQVYSLLMNENKSQDYYQSPIYLKETEQ